MADDCSSEYAGQHGQRQERYGKMDTAAEETWGWQQKICWTMEIVIFGKIYHYGRICILSRIEEVDKSPPRALVVECRRKGRAGQICPAGR